MLFRSLNPQLEETVRLQAFKKLKNGLDKSSFRPQDFPFLWNGLYYSKEIPKRSKKDFQQKFPIFNRKFYSQKNQVYYHSDTMRKQNALAKEIMGLNISPFVSKASKDVNSTLEWLKNGLVVLKKRWNTIDYNRANKFMYLVRMLVTQALKYIENSDFKKSVSEWKNNLCRYSLSGIRSSI